MIQVIKSNTRGLADHGWLVSRHTFSFAEYYEPTRMGFSVLRVINQDQIDGGTGFSTHPHRDMEIISYVISGALEHKDSMGTSTVILPGEVQRMSAGTGIRHSEYNQLKSQKTHFLQIWILPEQAGIQPSYDQKSFEDKFKSNDLILIGSKSGRDGSISIHQDVDLYACKSDTAGKKDLRISPERQQWVQVIRGQVSVSETILEAGDGAGLRQTNNLQLSWLKDSEFLLFDLP